MSPVPPPGFSPPKSSRLTGYGWAFVRDGSGIPLAGGGQLGGSQSGIRLDYRLANGLALSGRASLPLENRHGSEAALGIRWRPAATVPIDLFAERRIALGKGGRDAFALMAAGGTGPVTLPADLRLELYAQAGLVGLRRRDGFADGALSVTHPILERGAIRLSAGGGIWGAIQPGVERVDIGPRLRLTLAHEGAVIGAALDWRQRVTGNAAPQSGLALTLDTSF